MVQVYVDGIGRIRSFDGAMRRMHAGTAGTHATLASTFCMKCMPYAAEAQAIVEQAATRARRGSAAAMAGEGGAASAFDTREAWLRSAQQSVGSAFIFARVWNRFMDSLRAEDLLSDEEHAYMCYGAVDADSVEHPLILFGPALRRMFATVVRERIGEGRSAVASCNPHCLRVCRRMRAARQWVPATGPTCSLRCNDVMSWAQKHCVSCSAH